ncbi:MAG: hypothetical protein NWF00_05980 [Candidatus Bathyarchaeota archaeon]|nr:hypothetical protein [Candidatus Bathyarchaeota archaeon]
MRSQNRIIRRPLTDTELQTQLAKRFSLGGEDLTGIIEKISLERVPLEERRREAKKPLYIVRYE